MCGHMMHMHVVKSRCMVPGGGGGGGGTALALVVLC